MSNDHPIATKPWYQLDMMSDPVLNQVLLFYLSESWTGMTDLGECLESASRVQKNDPWSWTLAWESTADRLAKGADRARAGKLVRTAGQSYLRAASYYRAAAHRHPDPASRHMIRIANEAVRCFHEALSLVPDIGGVPVLIPYADTTLPGYFFKAPGAKARTPLLLVEEGRDAWAQDCVYVAREAVARGISCLLFDGPGQGEVVRLQRLVFRPDWENVVSPVVDWAQKQPGVDPERIGIVGMSMGGALVPRAVAYERRLKLAVANPGVLDWSRIITGYFTENMPDLMPLLDSDPAAFDATMKALMDGSVFLDWAMKDMVWRHGGTSPSEMIGIMRRFNATNDASLITARVLVIDGDAEEYGQAKDLYEALRCPKDYLKFRAEDTAQLHVQTGAFAFASTRIMDWVERYI